MWNQEVQVAPELAYLKGLHPAPLLLLHVDQGLGCNNLQRDRSLNLGGEDASSSESNTSTVETLPEDIPDELGHEVASFTSF